MTGSEESPTPNYSIGDPRRTAHHTPSQAEVVARVSAEERARGEAVGRLNAPSFFDDVVEFMQKFDIDYTGPSRLLPHDLRDFREGFHHEEIEEYELHRQRAEDIFHRPRMTLSMPASFIEEKAEMLDALVDSVYVILGTCRYHGWDFNEAWRRVHAANMAKVRSEEGGQHANGKALRHATHDVVKPPGWLAPNHTDLV